jgi:NAD(P)-dependent dehydrogenase (short-subunit alcohol dehydrogenase family)
VRALVTGAAAGLARGVAATLARSGLYERIVITYRTTPPDKTLDLIHQAGAQATAHRVDFLDDERRVTETLARAVHDDGPFDVLVHGVGPMVIKRFARSTLGDYREMFGVRCWRSARYCPACTSGATDASWYSE